MFQKILKFFALLLLWGYKWALSPMIHALSPNQGCIHQPSCSENMRQQIERYGFKKGVWLGLLQLKSCHPFFKKAVSHPEIS